MKVYRILTTVLLLIAVSTGALASNKQIEITINGIKLQTDVSPKIVNNRTLVPMRAIFEFMGAEVNWDGYTKTVTGIKGNNEIRMQVGNTKANINGKDIILDTPAIITNGSTLVPVRFIA